MQMVRGLACDIVIRSFQQLPQRCFPTLFIQIADGCDIIQDKNLRALVLTCLCQCFHSYLGRVGVASRPSEVNAYLIKHTKPLLQSLRKTNLQQPDQHVSGLASPPTHQRLTCEKFKDFKYSNSAVPCQTGNKVLCAKEQIYQGANIPKVQTSSPPKGAAYSKFTTWTGCCEADLHKNLRKGSGVWHRHTPARVAARHGQLGYCADRAAQPHHHSAECPSPAQSGSVLCRHRGWKDSI